MARCVSHRINYHSLRQFYFISGFANALKSLFQRNLNECNENQRMRLISNALGDRFYGLQVITVVVDAAMKYFC